MFPPRNSPRPLPPNPFQHALPELLANIRAHRLRGVRDGRDARPALGDELPLARVPGGEERGGGGGAY
jgi:hypothetical protein